MYLALGIFYMEIILCLHMCAFRLWRINNITSQ